MFSIKDSDRTKRFMKLEKKKKILKISSDSCYWPSKSKSQKGRRNESTRSLSQQKKKKGNRLDAIMERKTRNNGRTDTCS